MTSTSILAASLFFFHPILTFAQQCHVQTACLEALLVNITSNSNYNECLQSCQAQMSPQCNYFNFYTTTNVCYMFDDCPAQSSCGNDCYSGERSCPLNADCSIPGVCDGILVKHEFATSIDECINKCQEDNECQYCTFLTTTGSCDFYSECNAFDESCSACVTNNRDCPTSGNSTTVTTTASSTTSSSATTSPTVDSYNLVFLVGSGYSANYYTAEVLDLSGQSRQCDPVTNFNNNYGSLSTYINNQMLACGGYLPDPSKCFFYDPQSNQWTETTPMNNERGFGQSIQLDAQNWWVTGDWGFGNGLSTEIYNTADNSFTESVDLPAERCFHNLVRVDESNIMLLGNGDPTSEVYSYNQDTEIWSNLPNSLVGRDQPMAGFIRFSNGSSFVVLAGGYPDEVSSEYFSLDTQTWKMGPDLSYNQYLACVAQTDDTFYLLGGKFQGSQDVIKFDLESESWAVMPEKLQVPRHSFTCSWVPDDFVPCN